MSNLRQQLRILHIIHDLSVGGLQRLVIDMLKVLSEHNDIRNSFVIYTIPLDDVYLNEIKEINNLNSYIFYEKTNKRNFFIKLFRLIKIILKEKPHILQLHDAEVKKSACFLKVIFPYLKIFYTIHDTNIYKLFSKKNILAGNLIIDKHIAISKAVKEDSEKFSVKRVNVIYNGIDVKRYSKHKKQEQSVDNNDCMTIINIARFALPKKGQDVLVKALYECKKNGMKFRCNLVGGIGIETMEGLTFIQNMVKEYDLSNEIQFLGNRHDIPELLASSDLFVLPSRHEGFGLVVVEAMSAGIPVIASNVDGPSEIITHGVSGLLFENENHLDLAGKIMELYNDRQKMRQIAENGFERAKDFSIENMCNNYFNLYKSVLNRGKA